MRYILYGIIASLAAIALYPVVKKVGRSLVGKYKQIEEAAKDDDGSKPDS